MRFTYEIKDDIVIQLGVSTSVGFYTEAILEDWIDKAHKFAAAFKKWPMTEGRVSTTYVVDSTTDEVGFNYPEGWKPDSIRLLRIGGKRFKKLNFNKYQEFREDWPSDQAKVFSDHGRLYFINPLADASGTTTLWGQYTPIFGSDDLTVFSDMAEEGNEAIIEEVMSYAKKKEKKLTEAIAHHETAKKILDEIWQRIKDEQFGYQSEDDEGMFKRMDIIQGDFHSDLIKRNQWF